MGKVSTPAKVDIPPEQLGYRLYSACSRLHLPCLTYCRSKGPQPSQAPGNRFWTVISPSPELTVYSLLKRELDSIGIWSDQAPPAIPSAVLSRFLGPRSALLLICQHAYSLCSPHGWLYVVVFGVEDEGSSGVREVYLVRSALSPTSPSTLSRIDCT